SRRQQGNDPWRTQRCRRIQRRCTTPIQWPSRGATRQVATGWGGARRAGSPPWLLKKKDTTQTRSLWNLERTPLLTSSSADEGIYVHRISAPSCIGSRRVYATTGGPL